MLRSKNNVWVKKRCSGWKNVFCVVKWCLGQKKNTVWVGTFCLGWKTVPGSCSDRKNQFELKKWGLGRWNGVSFKKYCLRRKYAAWVKKQWVSGSKNVFRDLYWSKNCSLGRSNGVWVLLGSYNDFPFGKCNLDWEMLSGSENCFWGEKSGLGRRNASSVKGNWWLGRLVSFGSCLGR